VIRADPQVEFVPKDMPEQRLRQRIECDDAERFRDCEGRTIASTKHWSAICLHQLIEQSVSHFLLPFHSIRMRLRQIDYTST